MDENINKFGRAIKKPKDCVINALEIIGIINTTDADIMRIVVGDNGIGKKITDLSTAISQIVIAPGISDKIKGIQDVINFVEIFNNIVKNLTVTTGANNQTRSF